MASTYEVNYIVNVQSNQARNAINRFKMALNLLTKATKPLTDLQRQIMGLTQTLGNVNRTNYTIKVETKPATQKIGKLIRALQMAQEEASKLSAMGVQMRASFSRQQPSRGGKSTPAPVVPSRTQAARPQTARPQTAPAPLIARSSQNLGYKLWGPTPLPNNGGMALDMLKGMGIAYGLAGLGTLVSNIVNQSVEYDSVMKTVENILKTHDEKGDFSKRFASMTRTVRDVGMETKFKVTEVAAATKFLAMAGMDLESIQQSIRPIADIALVGDTDLGETADLVTNIMTAYNIAPSKMRNAADIMTNTFTMSNTTLTEIAESYKYAASLLSAGGISFEEATSAIGILGDAGVKGSQAGTTLRTIMANIVNPTKKQERAWTELDISRTNEDGSRKDLLQIFKELNAKNLDVSSYYKIFHKTAATGAVALASHVDKWENVFLENFLSGGLSARLADEKKNTLQGLWAQLVSVVTDQGVTAFNDVQGGIRGLLHHAIDWTKGSQAKQIFKDLSSTMMEFVNVMITASEWFFDFYKMFGPMIKVWMKFQLFIWPVVKAVTAFRSVFLGLLGLRKVGSVLLGMVPSFKILGHTIANTSYIAAGASGGYTAGATMGGSSVVAGLPMPMGYSFLPPLSDEQLAKAAKGLKNLRQPGVYIKDGMSDRMKDHIKTRWANYNAYHESEQKIYNRRARYMQLKAGAANLGKMGLGAVGAYIGMSQMTKDNANGWDKWSGGLAMAAGTAAMVGGPVGWVAAAVLGLGAVGASIGSFVQNLNGLSNAVQTFTSRHQLLDGVLLGGNTRIEKYLEFVWRKNYDINDLIQRRIELMKELLGIESPDATTTKDVGNEVYKDMYEKFYAADSIWGSSRAAQRAADLFNNYGEQYGLKIYKKDGDWTYRDANGNEITFNNPDGTSDTNDAVMYDVASAMELLHGQYRAKILDENQHRLAQMLYGRSTAADVQSWRDTFAATYGPSSWANLIKPNEWNEDTDVAKYWAGEDIARSYMGAQLLWSSMYQLVEAQNAIADFKTKLESGQLTELDVVKALRWGDYDILGQTLADYNPNDIAGWYRNMGYYGDGVWRDPSGRETPEVMAQTAAGQMERLLSSIHQLGLDSDPATEALQNYANTLLTLAQSFMGQQEALEGSHDGEIRELNGQKWRWNANSKQWELLDDGNQPAQISQALADMSGNMLNLLETAQTVNSNWPVMFPTATTDGSSWFYDPLSPYDLGSGGGNYNTMLYNPLPLYNSLTGDYGTNPFTSLPNWTSSWSSLYTPQMTYQTTGVTMTPQQMGNAVAALKSNTPTTPTGANNPTDTTNPTGTNSKDYKSHYLSSAQPKQLNIHIDNLMKVDKVDLSNPDQAAVVDRLKREVAYALYEAAADGATMLNGLT